MIRVTTIWTNMSGFFNSVEVNSTFLPVSQLKNCYATTPDYLTFSIKMDRNITHTRRLHDVRRPLNDFLDLVLCLGTSWARFS